MSLHIILAIIFFLSGLSSIESEIAGYYLGNDKTISIDLVLNHDFTWCKYFSSFNDPCHNAGMSRGIWHLNSDTIILEYHGSIRLEEGGESLVPKDTFQIKKDKLIKIGPPYGIGSLKVKLQKKDIIMSCENLLPYVDSLNETKK